MTDYDLIDGPRYEDRHLTVSTCTEAVSREERRRDHVWGVYYRGRLVHGGLSSSAEADVARGMYAEHIPATDYRWRLLTNPFKHPSPSTDDRRRAGVAS